MVLDEGDRPDLHNTVSQQDRDAATSARSLMVSNEAKSVKPKTASREVPIDMKFHARASSGGSGGHFHSNPGLSNNDAEVRGLRTRTGSQSAPRSQDDAPKVTTDALECLVKDADDMVVCTLKPGVESNDSGEKTRSVPDR